MSCSPILISLFIGLIFLALNNNKKLSQKKMPALNIICSGATYTTCTALETMRHRCPQFMPGGTAPIVRPKEAEEESESEDEE
ncbi:hypothetical protein, conserved [Angomonas deanei]|uniref:Uncharacterized protein n=1 Tax=Angomonas deanei TaxID=59799 RepID=A0A7G2C8A3_9TRYP|nr:hypothetical protein, conserved [Angomonas deanei]